MNLHLYPSESDSLTAVPRCTYIRPRQQSLFLETVRIKLCCLLHSIIFPILFLYIFLEYEYVALNSVAKTRLDSYETANSFKRRLCIPELFYRTTPMQLCNSFTDACLFHIIEHRYFSFKLIIESHLTIIILILGILRLDKIK
jgi:hypothetical protein